VGLTFYALNTWLADGTFVDKAMFLAWALAAQWQNFASTFFHWFSCINLPYVNRYISTVYRLILTIR